MRTFIPSRRPRGIVRLVVVLVVSLGWACGSSPTSPSPGPGPAPAPVGPPPVPVRVFGVVTTDHGTPVAGALVNLTYQPDLAAAQGASTRTGAIRNSFRVMNDSLTG